MALSKLHYNKAIISTAEKLVPTNELLSRLGSLHEELSALVQDQTDLESLNSYRADLVNKKLLKHKDPGVRAFAACCLSDILRLYAPDAPYTDTQLTEIFKLVLSQFEQLGDPDNGYYFQQTYLITRLLEYRSIVLLTDLPTSNKLLMEVFQIFYDESKKFNPSLYKVIGGILGEIISEFDSVPMPVLKLIFNKFLTYNPQEIPKGLGIESNCGYEITLILCDAYSSRMSRHFTKYYSEVLYSLTNEENNSSYESKVTTSRTLDRLHTLTTRIWETVPELVSSVIGFVYHELCSDKELLRIKATKFVGDILSLDSDVNFITTYQDTFNAWLTKIADISVDVRIQWVDTIPKVLTTRTDIAEDINKGLAKTFLDSDHRVRKASVMVFSEMPTLEIWKTIKNDSIYTSLLFLTREKNRDVRELCISIVSEFYCQSIENVERSAQNKATWVIIDTIPSVLFNLYYINDLNINEQVDTVLFEKLLPLDVNDKERVDRLLTVIAHFDKKAFSSFFAFNKRQLQMSVALTKYIEFCERLNNKDANSSTDALRVFGQTIEWLVSGLTDKIKATAALESLKELNDPRIYYLIKTCVTPDLPFVTLKNSFKELINKLQDPGLFRKYNIRAVSTIIPKEIAKQIQILLYRSSPLIYNVSNIPLLLDIGSNTDKEEAALKRKLLDKISVVNPSLFKDQVTTLKDIINNVNDTEKEESDTLPLNEALKTLYKISKTLKDQIDWDDSFFLTRLVDFAIEGDPTAAKYAVKLLSLSPSAEQNLERIKIQILPLDLKKDKQFASHIMVLSEIFKYFPTILDKDSTEIVSYLIKEVLLSNQVVGDSKKEAEWVDDFSINKEKYSPLSCKLFALKLFTNKLRSIASEASKDELTKAFIKKTMKLFFYLIASGGELISEYNKEFYPTPSNYQTKLRCCAGLQVLKLARVPNLNEFIKPIDIIKLINIVEDESLQVRKTFLDQLKDLISNELISIKFLPLIFFTAYEPDQTLKTSTKTWINFTFGKESFKKGTFFERALPRLIHAIAHHPDIVEGFEADGDAYLNSLTTAVDYLIFYFDSIAAQENFSLLYYLSERVKNYQDKLTDNEEDEELSESENVASKNGNCTRMYVIGELAQMILLQLKERKNWQHSAYPGKLNLPNDLFLPFDTIQDAQASFKTYLPDKYADKLQMNIKTKVNRIMSTSQTQRQRAQKRMLTNEYQHEAGKRKRAKRVKNPDQNESEDDSDVENSDTYVPTKSAGNKKVYETVRKNLRVRKEVDYNDSNEEDGGEEELL